jgi:hypothetical protein
MAAKGRHRKAPPALEHALSIRGNARLAEVFNSGLEVWLYDASHRATLKASGACHRGRRAS